MIKPIQYGSSTDIALALNQIQLIYRNTPIDIIIITDGEDTIDDNPQDTIIFPDDATITIIGIGTQIGAGIISHYDASWKVIYKKYDGKDVISRLDVGYLEWLRDRYDAELFLIEKPSDISKIYEDTHRKYSELFTLPYQSSLIIFGAMLVFSGLVFPYFYRK